MFPSNEMLPDELRYVIFSVHNYSGVAIRAKHKRAGLGSQFRFIFRRGNIHQIPAIIVKMARLNSGVPGTA